MTDARSRLRYHCVSIVGGTAACPAVHELGSQRLLSADAPRLPLATCDRPEQCQCTYRHFDDRRVGPRRAIDSGRPRSSWQQPERRHFRGRRATDILGD